MELQFVQFRWPAILTFALYLAALWIFRKKIKFWVKAVSFFAVFSVCVCVYFSGWHVTGKFEGMVVDNSTGKPVKDVVVLCRWVVLRPLESHTVIRQEKIITGEDGKFTVPRVKVYRNLKHAFEKLRLIFIHPYYERYEYKPYEYKYGHMYKFQKGPIVREKPQVYLVSLEELVKKDGSGGFDSKIRQNTEYFKLNENFSKNNAIQHWLKIIQKIEDKTVHDRCLGYIDLLM